MADTQQTQGSLFDSLRLFWQLLKEDIINENKRLIAGFAFSLVTGCLAITIPYFIQLIIDKAIPQKNSSLLLYYAIGLIGVFILSFSAWYVQVVLTARASENIFRNFKLRLSEAILKKHLSFFARYPSSDLLTRMVADLTLVSEFFHKYLLKSLVDFVFILVLFIYILFFNWQLSLIAFLGIPVVGIIMALLDKPITRTSASARRRLSDQNDRVLDMLQGYKEIRFFQQNEKMLAHVEPAFSDFAEANFKFVRTMGITEHLLEMASYLIFLLPIIFGGYAICRGESDLTIGLLVAFQTYLIMLVDGVHKISMGFAESIKAAPPIKRLLELLDYPVEEQPRITDWNDIPDSMAIEFKQIAFGYLKDKKVLTDFNLRIGPAEKVCIMGQSGSGKSTIANLLLRFLSPETGEITVGKVNIQKYPLAAYLSHFSYVWQDTYLFRLSVKDNVKLGWYSVPDEMVKEVIEQVGMRGNR